jgi:DNA (cytosine-5)-methyltransferase 1
MGGRMRIGGLFSGYGGFEMAARTVFGGTVAWHSEIDPAASKILAHHWPDVPNLGDITTVDWTSVESVDVLTGGSPCQDVSAAGLKALGNGVVPQQGAAAIRICLTRAERAA